LAVEVDGIADHAASVINEQRRRSLNDESLAALYVPAAVQ